MESVELIFLDFQLEKFLTLSEYLEDDEFLHQLTAPVMPPTFELEESDASELCRRMLEMNSGNYGNKLKMVKIKVLLAELFARFFIDELQMLNERRTPEWLKNLCHSMRRPENFIEGLKRMQKLAPCTQEHLCKSFRKYLNKSPTEYINELRVNHAARLLSDSDEKISSIALDLHFQRLSRFYPIFQKHFGTTPSNYRRRSRRTKNAGV
jgi:AraC family cel operon transcriptional repressor